MVRERLVSWSKVHLPYRLMLGVRNVVYIYVFIVDLYLPFMHFFPQEGGQGRGLFVKSKVMREIGCGILAFGIVERSVRTGEVLELFTHAHCSLENGLQTGPYPRGPNSDL
jgi:hypothetical protein